MKKKILSLTLAMSIMSTMGATVFASDDVVNTTNEVVSSTSVATLEVGVEQTFVEDDGTEIKYFLDENLMPYTIENSETVCIALPLEHLQVTDPLLLAELREDNGKIEIPTLNERSVFKTVISSSVYIPNYMSKSFDISGCNTSTVNLSNFLSSSTFRTNYYYSKDNGSSWYTYTSKDFNCTTSSVVYSLPSGTNYGKLGITTLTGESAYYVNVTAY